MNIFDLFEKASETLEYPKIHFPFENEMLVFAQASELLDFRAQSMSITKRVLCGMLVSSRIPRNASCILTGIPK
jgi:hypothetical protein